jgi:hypothetical protein
MLPLVRFINGTIMDSVSKEAIAGATVSTNASVSTKTDASGFYSLAVPSGTYDLTGRLEPMYYANSTVTVFTASSATVVRDIELMEKPTGAISGAVTST